MISKNTVGAISKRNLDLLYKIKGLITRHGNVESLPSYQYLEKLFSRYQVENLVTVDPKTFKKKIDEFLQLEDYEMEGFKDPYVQRDLTTKFQWGHNHDFGDFYLEGKMTNRHLSLITECIDSLHLFSRNLEGKRVLDIGVWTGGTSLVFAAMGAQVTAVEEVNKYIQSLKYLKYAFDIKNLDPKNLSIYDCNIPEFQDTFDYLFMAGVLYHLTDPILALRILFNCLKDGGVCIVQTAIYKSRKPILSFKRRRWNWFFPSPSAVVQMMSDVGFTGITVSPFGRNGAFFIGKRKHHVDMRRDGLSIRTIR